MKDRLTWDEWRAGRDAKRELLKRHGLDAPSRRRHSADDRRLRAAFNGARAPVFAEGAELAGREEKSL